VVTAIAALRERGAANPTTEDDDGFIEEAASLQI